jgi:hypothetical protein
MAVCTIEAGVPEAGEGRSVFVTAQAPGVVAMNLALVALGAASS